MTTSDEAAWLRQWRAAGDALRVQRAAALRAMTDAEARDASAALLALAAGSYRDPARETHSGLVEQQRLFHQARAAEAESLEPQ